MKNWKDRLGNITASSLYKLYSGPKTRENFIQEKVTELVTGQQVQIFKSIHMLNGIKYEPHAIDRAQEDLGITFKKKHFERDGFWATPDGVGYAGKVFIEVKTPKRETFSQYEDHKKVKSNWMWQLIGQFYATGARLGTLMVYNPWDNKAIYHHYTLDYFTNQLENLAEDIEDAYAEIRYRAKIEALIVAKEFDNVQVEF